MKKVLIQAGAALLGALAGLPAVAGDPLQTPARMAARAPKAMLLALAQAGQRTVAVGERGIIVVRDGGAGAPWRQARVPVSVTLTGVAFADAANGWAVGHDGAILSTNDGGAQWTSRFDGKQANALMLADARAAVEKARAAGGNALADAENALGDIEAAAKFGPSRPLFGVWFGDARTGYAVGAYGQAFRTTDGGANWTSMGAGLPNPEGLHYNAVAGGPGGILAIAGEGGYVYRSTDGGTSWQRGETGYSGQLYGVMFTGRSMLAYGFGGHVFRSEDGGATWRETPAVTKKSLVGGAMQGSSIVLAAQDGALLRSEDDGASFRVLRQGDAVPTSSMLDVGGALLLSGIGGVREGGR
ncbi:WD40/YVTN/BNR-like repeat-containing protein [Pseudoduganella violaceinigra]|uniref:WD40/YVTN/BNR-like repeat-containing protein n=1 Tax=Pseudoduganella violaceinigra TaxID=246602 RepID=UPI00040C734A|nr:YCF48-related protein [Pseudoduganella violaceinigra]